MYYRITSLPWDNYPKNGSRTGLSVRFSGFLARNADAATCMLQGEMTLSKEQEKRAIETVALSPIW